MPVSSATNWREFARRRDGMWYALEGGLWFHRHVWQGERMAHLVSSDRVLLLHAGDMLGAHPRWLQYKPLKHPETGLRIEAWHWDLRGRFLVRGIELLAEGVASV